jgi:hypothetical protein
MEMEAPIINDVFKEARSRLEKRAIQSTRIDFELIVEDILAEARAGNIDRTRFANLLRAEITRFGRIAYRDGLIDGGVIDGVTDEDDDKIIRQEIANARGFVSNFGASVFSEGGISDEAAAGKPALWFKGAILPLYQAGRVSADANGMYEFARVSPTNDKCPDCVRLEGQVHRLKAWASRNLLVPRPGQETDCEGWQCGHQLIPTTGRAKGKF